MANQSDNFPATLLLAELLIQCQLFSKSLDYLKHASDHWINLCSGVDDGETRSPIEIIGHCTVCLSSMASIRRLLFDLDRRDEVIRHRCTRLRELLGNPSTPQLSSALVRNSWEHLDERLDDQIPAIHGKSVSPVYVASYEPTDDMLTLKRFDPNSCSIWFLDSQVPLRECAQEVELIFERINVAFSKLQSETFSIYPA